MLQVSKKFIIIVIIMGLTGFLILLASIDSVNYMALPKCPIKLITGIDCPSCGGTRALHSLLHGHFLQALSYNYFLVIGIPYFLMAAIVSFVPFFKDTIIRKIILGKHAAIIYVILFFGWWIIRNIIHC